MRGQTRALVVVLLTLAGKSSSSRSKRKNFNAPESEGHSSKGRGTGRVGVLRFKTRDTPGMIQGPGTPVPYPCL